MSLTLSSTSYSSPSISPKREHEQEEYVQNKRRNLNRLEVLEFDNLACSTLTDETFSAALNKAKPLNEFSFPHSNTYITDKSIDLLKERVTDLTKIRLQVPFKVTATSLGSLVSASTQLRIIDCSFSDQVGEVFAAALANCPFLEELNISNCQNVNDKTIELIALNVTHLKVLNLEGCDSYTDQALQALAKNPLALSLQSLNLSRCSSIQDKGIGQLTLRAIHLKDLNLSWNEQITDAIIPIVATLEKLESLDLSGDNQITDAPFISMKDESFPQLKILDLSKTSVTHLTVQKLTQIVGKSLESLSLNRCSGIDVQTLDFLPLFSRLNSLALAHNNLKQFLGALEKLSKCQHLENLDISYIRSSEYLRFKAFSIIPLIRSMPNLKEVRVAGSGNAEDFQEISSTTNLHLNFA